MRRSVSPIPFIVVAVLAVGLWRLSPLWPGPPLPPGATRLHIDTAALHLVPNLGCPTALLGPVRPAASNGELIFIAVPTGEPVRVVWPSGWVAWLINGRGVLVDRDGSIVGWEGDVIEARFGGGEGGDGAFHVCEIGW